MGARELHLLAQAIGKRHARWRIHFDLAAIDFELHRHRIHLSGTL
jgi:hypothetical protein